jgi:ubiquitin carboxyl-terminal hydrolase 2/21
LKEYNDLRQLMWHKDCIVSPKRFLLCIQSTAKKSNMSLFTGYAQNDLPEFIMFLFNSIHESLKREVYIPIQGNVRNPNDVIAKKCFEMMNLMFAKEYSDIVSLFYGIQVSHVRTMNDDMLNSHPEPFFMLHLPIPKKKDPTLNECFDVYTQPELLQGENQYLSDKTKTKIDAKRETTFFQLPDILIIHLKRFDNVMRKDNAFVHFSPSEAMDLSSYVIDKHKSHNYELYGVCNHMGTTRGGHYTAYVKVKNGNWYNFNDSAVRKVSEKQVVTPRAYCLFYRRMK